MGLHLPDTWESSQKFASLTFAFLWNGGDGVANSAVEYKSSAQFKDKCFYRLLLSYELHEAGCFDAADMIIWYW